MDGGFKVSTLGKIQLISQYELSSNTGTVTFSSIPTDYNNLNVFCHVRAVNSAEITLRIRINSVSTSTYDSQYYGGTNGGYFQVFSSASPKISFVDTAHLVPDGRWPSNYFGGIRIDVPSYSHATIPKMLVMESGTPTNTTYTNRRSSAWAQNNEITGSITNLSFFLSDGNLASGSCFYLFGHRI